jgi:hypothetical protein
VVTLKTQAGVYKRPIARVAKINYIPVEKEETSKDSEQNSKVRVSSRRTRKQSKSIALFVMLSVLWLNIWSGLIIQSLPSSDVIVAHQGTIYVQTGFMEFKNKYKRKY